ncbi:unnamed protein product [Paramecium pentaurelia]|uniref:Uncharacterized protein n=1 Tax=Paramecium pentaurelia TaxID=43138 RepID=A0A8S1TVJ1_9CILI|nr:unnamed protein product [Paramecium pentaurelia]
MQVLVLSNLLNKQRISCFKWKSKSLKIRILMQENEKMIFLLGLVQIQQLYFINNLNLKDWLFFELQKWANFQTPFQKLQIRYQELSQVNFTLLNYSLYNYKSSMLLLQIPNDIEIEEKNSPIKNDHVIIHFGEWKDAQKHGFGKLLELDLSYDGVGFVNNEASGHSRLDWFILVMISMKVNGRMINKQYQQILLIQLLSIC